jgi:Tfp pilus assembly protein PilF
LWSAAYGLGVLKLEARDYRAAQDAFARALLVDRGNAGALHGLAVASYYLGDLRTAKNAVTWALKERPGDRACLRGAALIAAANGERSHAADYAEAYGWRHRKSPRQTSSAAALPTGPRSTTKRPSEQLRG